MPDATESFASPPWEQEHNPSEARRETKGCQALVALPSACMALPKLSGVCASPRISDDAQGHGILKDTTALSSV